MITKAIETKFQTLWNKIRQHNLHKGCQGYFYLPEDKYIEIGDNMSIVGIYVPEENDKFFCLVRINETTYTDMYLDILSNMYVYQLIMRLETTINNKLS